MRDKRKEKEKKRERDGKEREDEREGSAQMGPKVRLMKYTNKNRQIKRLIRVDDKRKKKEPHQKEPQV